MLRRIREAEEAQTVDWVARRHSEGHETGLPKEEEEKKQGGVFHLRRTGSILSETNCVGWDKVCFTSAQSINLDENSRQVAGIPQDAEYVSYCDGGVDHQQRRIGMAGHKWVSEGRSELDNILRLMMRGGFVYF